MISEKDILEERARNLAKEVKTTNGNEIRRTYIEFSLLPEIYAIPGACLTAVLPLHDFTPIPGVPSFVLGVINARGKITSIINIKQLLNLREKGIAPHNNVMIIKHGEMEFGIAIDSIRGAREISDAAILPPPAHLDVSGKEYISGVTGEGTIILDPEAIFNSKSLIINQK